MINELFVTNHLNYKSPNSKTKCNDATPLIGGTTSDFKIQIEIDLYMGPYWPSIFTMYFQTASCSPYFFILIGFSKFGTFSTMRIYCLYPSESVTGVHPLCPDINS